MNELKTPWPLADPKYRVLVRFEHIGFHCWPQAPPECRYLRNDHRHCFRFEVALRVAGHDREIEVHQLKASCQQWAQKVFTGTKTWSCEKFSELLLLHLRACFQPTWGLVECWEDGECGGSCEMSWPAELKYAAEGSSQCTG